MALLKRIALLSVNRLGELDHFFNAGCSRWLPAHRNTLVHQCRQRYFPAIANLTKPVAVIHANISEKHFVEFGTPRHLLDRAHFDAGVFHVHDEHRQPLVLRRRRIGTRHDDAEIAMLRTACPDFLAVDHPIVAVALRLGADARKVRPRRWFREQLTPNFIAAHCGFKIARNHLWLAMSENRRDAHAKANGVKPSWHVIFAFFLIEDDLLHWRRALPAERLWPCDTNIARTIFDRLPGLGTRYPVSACDRFTVVGGGGCKPSTDLRAIGGFFRGIIKVHRLIL